MPSILNITVIILILIYFLENLKILSGLKKKVKLTDDQKNTINGISVIIPLRNEENNCFLLVETVKNLKHPTCPIEIIFVDDFSTDQTATFLENLTSNNPAFVLLKSNLPSSKLKGKPNALNSGIKISKYEVIALTDADMSLNPNWLVEIESLLNEDSEIAMICGPTTVKKFDLWSSIQSTDWSYLMTVASGSFNSGNPMSAIGNNMIFRKSAYEKIGGYSNLDFSITEDFELFQSFIQNNLKVIFPLNPKLLHETLPNPDLKTFLSQRKRWIKGGLKIHLRGFITLLAGLFGQLAILLSIFSSFFLFFTVILLKFGLDFLMISVFCNTMKIKLNSFHFVLFEFYYFCYSLILPFIFIFQPRIVWKDRNY